MKAFAVERVLHKPGLTILHTKFFHGQQTRGSPYRAGIPFFGDQEKRSLRITHNVRRIPDVFSPGSSLVISVRVRDALSELPFVEYRPVSFPELIDFEGPPLGDTSWENIQALREAAESQEWPGWPDNLFEYLPQALEEQRKSVGGYFEMVVARLKEAVTEFPDATPIQVPRPYTIDKTNEMRLCPALLEKYPVFWWSQIVFAEWAFRRIEPFLDRAYIEVVEFEM
jgi:hypothetical protein